MCVSILITKNAAGAATLGQAAAAQQPRPGASGDCGPALPHAVVPWVLHVTTARAWCA